MSHILQIINLLSLSSNVSDKWKTLFVFFPQGECWIRSEHQKQMRQFALKSWWKRSLDVWTSEPALKTSSKKVSHFNSFFFLFFLIKVPPDYLIYNCVFFFFFFYTHQTFNSNDSPLLRTYTHCNTQDSCSKLFGTKVAFKNKFCEREMPTRKLMRSKNKDSWDAFCFSLCIWRSSGAKFW